MLAIERARSRNEVRQRAARVPVRVRARMRIRVVLTSMAMPRGRFSRNRPRGTSAMLRMALTPSLSNMESLSRARSA